MILIIILVLTLFGSNASAFNGPLNEEALKSVLAKEYAHEFASEFRELKNSGKFKDFYQYFAPKAERSRFMNGVQTDFDIIASEKSIRFVSNKTMVIEIEIIDLLEKKFAINGIPYTHDWSTSPERQRDRISSLLTGEARNFFDYLMESMVGKSFAVPPAGVAIVSFCIRGGCQMIYFAGQRSALFIAKSASTLRTAAERTSQLRHRYDPVIAKAYETSKNTLKWIWEDIATDPRIHIPLKNFKAGAKTPANWVVKPLEATGFFLKKLVDPTVGAIIGTGLGIASWALFNKTIEEGQKTGLTFDEALRCLFNGQPVDKAKCTFASPQIPIADTPIDHSVITNWCPTAKVNEVQMADFYADGRRVFMAAKLDTDPNKPGTAVPKHVIRVPIVKTENIELDGIRIYEFEQSTGILNRVVAPIFSPGYKGESLITRKHGRTHDELDTNMDEQVRQRDALMEASIIGKRSVLNAEQIADVKNPNWIPKRISKDIDQEIRNGKSILTTLRQSKDTCDAMKRINEEAKKTAPAPATSKPADK